MPVHLAIMPIYVRTFRSTRLQVRYQDLRIQQFIYYTDPRAVVLLSASTDNNYSRTAPNCSRTFVPMCNQEPSYFTQAACFLIINSPKSSHHWSVCFCSSGTSSLAIFFSFTACLFYGGCSVVLSFLSLIIIVTIWWILRLDGGEFVFCRR